MISNKAKNSMTKKFILLQILLMIALPAMAATQEEMRTDYLKRQQSQNAYQQQQYQQLLTQQHYPKPQSPYGVPQPVQMPQQQGYTYVPQQPQVPQVQMPQTYQMPSVQSATQNIQSGITLLNQGASIVRMFRGGY